MSGCRNNTSNNDPAEAREIAMTPIQGEMVFHTTEFGQLPDHSDVASEQQDTSTGGVNRSV